MNMNQGKDAPPAGSMNRAAYQRPRQPKPAALLIFDKSRTPQMITLLGNATVGKNYPESDRNIRLSSGIVSRRHGEFLFNAADGSYYYIDNNSLNGTFINGEKLQPYNDRGSYPYKLSDGDIIRIDRSDLNNTHPDAVLIIFSTAFTGKEVWNRFDLSQPGELTIGRGKNCVLRLNDLMASRCHAVLRYTPEGWVLTDNNSTNGTGLNGEEMTAPTLLHINDVINISNTMLIFVGNALIYNSRTEDTASLIIDIREKRVSGGKLLLKDIHTGFVGGDFVLILGGSGAGKTTLIKAILGESRAKGKIILNGQDLYKNFKSMKSQIGMVPQFLTLRTNDTVRNTLLDTASIKLGKTHTKREMIDRVEQVISHVGITEHADKYIGDLSGGQQKKVSVANQLIGFRQVFICDEPDSGLDAASRMQQMEILKEISREGKIVMVISHEPDDAVEMVGGERRLLFTKVIVLARSSQDRAGHLAYYGDIHTAMEFFGVDRLQDIMLEINPPEEGGRGRADYYIRKFQMMKEGR